MIYPYVFLAETSLHLVRRYARMRWHRGRMRKRLRRLVKDLHPAATLSPELLQRMYKYHEEAQFVVYGALARMQGRRLSDAEQDRLLLLAVIAPLYDDLFTARTPDISYIRRLTQLPAADAPRSDSEALLRVAYMRLLKCSPDAARTVSHFRDVCHWREAALRQHDPAIPEADLFRITYHKRFHSMLLCYTAFDRYPSPAETAMAFPMAGLLQLTDDVFDIWKDIRAGMYTIPILYRRFGRLEKRFLAEGARFNQALARLPYPLRKKKEYAQTVHALHAMGWLAIRRLRQEARGAADVADLALLGRKKLVFGMHGSSTIWAWVRKVRDLTNLTSADGPTEPALRRELHAAGGT